ncbi:MAG: DNA repair protein RecN [Phycisphaeraceae bacterium]
MLRELHISNLAIIEDAHIELGERLNCFTGETGAGKSLVLGSFEVLLGLRSTADLLRDGADEGRVSGVFELRDPHIIRAINETVDAGLDHDPRNNPLKHPVQLLVTRKLFASGRTSVAINGQPATIQMLQAVGELLVDVHGQHDHQYLLKPGNQLLMLDRFAGCDELRERFGGLHRQLAELRQKQAELEASATLRRQQLELYEFQAGEIDQAAPVAGEYDELNARHRLLSNLEKIAQQSAAVYAALYDSEGAIVERLGAMMSILNDLAELDGELAEPAETTKSAMSQLQDVAFTINRYASRLDIDPAELGEVESRLNTLNKLIQKYGPAPGNKGGTLDDVLNFRGRLAEQIAKLRGQSDDMEHIADQITPVRNELIEVGRKLTQARKAGAKKLCPLVERELAEVGMADAKLDVQIETDEQDTPGSPGSPGSIEASGLDRVEVLIQPNPGQALRPLRKIASGGELSRVMLALKSILAQTDRISVLVFDEVDANIGGRLGTVIGGKLRKLAEHHQVLCITHLPQIAACAEHHLKISKTISKGQTRTTVQPLADEARVEEIADMLAGKGRTATTMKQAKELLGAGQQTKREK